MQQQFHHSLRWSQPCCQHVSRARDGPHPEQVLHPSPPLPSFLPPELAADGDGCSLPWSEVLVPRFLSYKSRRDLKTQRSSAVAWGPCLLPAERMSQ